MTKMDKIFKECVRTIGENTLLMWGHTYKK